MKKQEPTIRLSNQKCVAHPCGKTGFILKSDRRDFSAPVCADHLVTKLTEWDTEDKAEELRQKQVKEAEKKAKEANSVVATK